VDKYTWVDIGSSYLPSDILAALLLAQLECREYVQSSRRHIWMYYENHLRAWAKQQGVRLPVVPEHCEQAYHMFYMIFPALAQRQAFIAHLKSHGIQSVFHYLPLHLSPMGQKYGQPESDCPVTVDISDRLVRLPFYNELTDADLDRVVAAVSEFEV